MPYIKKTDRAKLDVMIDGLVPKIRDLNRNQASELVANLVIYALTSTCRQYMVGAQIDSIVKDLANRIETRGEANYCLCRILLEGMKPETGWSYHSLSDMVAAGKMAITKVFDVQQLESLGDADVFDAVAALDDATVEIERRLLSPYEDKAILKNGDMPCFNEPFALRPLSNPKVTCGCVCDPCQCDPLPPITDAFTQEQYDAIDEERRQDEG